MKDVVTVEPSNCCEVAQHLVIVVNSVLCVLIIKLWFRRRLRLELNQFFYRNFYFFYAWRNSVALLINGQYKVLKFNVQQFFSHSMNEIQFVTEIFVGHNSLATVLFVMSAALFIKFSVGSSAICRMQFNCLIIFQNPLETLSIDTS